MPASTASTASTRTPRLLEVRGTEGMESNVPQNLQDALGIYEECSGSSLRNRYERQDGGYVICRPADSGEWYLKEIRSGRKLASNPAVADSVPEDGWLTHTGWFGGVLGTQRDAHLHVQAMQDPPPPDPLQPKSGGEMLSTAGECIVEVLRITALGCCGCLSAIVHCLPQRSASKKDPGDSDSVSSDGPLQLDKDDCLNTETVEEIYKAKQDFISSFMASRPEHYTTTQLKRVHELLDQEQNIEELQDKVQRSRQVAKRNQLRARALKKESDLIKAELKRACERVDSAEKRNADLKAEVSVLKQQHDKEKQQHEKELHEIHAEQRKLESSLLDNKESLKEAMQVELDRILNLQRESFVHPAAWGFAVLGVSTPDKASVQRSYRNLMKKLHPDKAKDGSLDPRGAVQVIAQAKEACDIGLSGVKVPGIPCELCPTLVSEIQGKRRIRIKWSKPAGATTGGPVRRYIVAIKDPAFAPAGRAVTIQVLEPDYRQDLARYVSVDELTTFEVQEEDMKEMAHVWKHPTITIHVAAANEVGQSPWATAQVPLSNSARRASLTQAQTPQPQVQSAYNSSAFGGYSNMPNSCTFSKMPSVYFRR